MYYQKYIPCLPLRPYIECYFVWRTKAQQSDKWLDSPPNAFTAILFNLDGDLHVSLEPNASTRLSSSYISGQCIRNYGLKVNGPLNQIGVVFKPTGLFQFFGIPMYELTHTRYALCDVFPGNFELLEEKIQLAKTDQVRIALLDDTFLKLLDHRDQTWSGVDRAANLIISSTDNLSVQDLIKDSYMSRRTFERHFLERVGLSPKFYARIRRYGSLCAEIAGQRSHIDWDELVFKYGYFDQSHLIKDFKEFSGKAPSQYLLENNEVAHHIQPEE
ncbi:MAG: AraC family transcriptional regulator [Saprospiraceae bacterium]|nr:AraC family transcriptional regulator [Saprospiraceae bacterium]MCB9319304.1 AraC family transcriptional regulator [Lewinellaceae bacterium]